MHDRPFRAVAFPKTSRKIERFLLLPEGQRFTISFWLNSQRHRPEELHPWPARDGPSRSGGALGTLAYPCPGYPDAPTQVAAVAPREGA
jgi:hypothetical protein